jgi:hypothetical protein
VTSTERTHILKKHHLLLLLSIPVLIFLSGWLCLHLGWVMAGTILLRILQVLVAIAAVVILVFEVLILMNGDDSGWWLWLLGMLATFGISGGMIWICDRIFQAYGITSTFFSGFMKVLGALFDVLG